jgi:peptidyl-prolyl cis-trans isomerase D
MLQKLNQRFQGIFAWVIISLIAVTFAMFGIEYYMQSRSPASLKAEVNGEPITVNDFDLYFRRNQRPDESPEITAADEAKRKVEIVNKMILNTLANQSAASNGFSVMPSQVISTIQTIPQFQQDGHFSRDKYQQLLSHALFTPATFQTEVKQGILLNQQRFALSGTDFVLPYEVKQFIELSMQTRNYDYMLIPYRQFQKQTKIDDKDIRIYYQKHSDEFISPEKVKIEFIRLSMRDIREKADLDEEQVQHYYDENKSNYTKPARWHVAHIFFAYPKGASIADEKRIQKKAEEVSRLLKASPDQFEHLVQTRSDDTISRVDSGVLPWIVAGQSEYDKALVDLTVVGQLSAPIKTSQGYEIFKLIDYKPLQLKPLNAVKKAIKEQLLLEQVQSDYSRSLEQLADLAYQTPDTLSPVADALHLKIEREEPFSREGGVSGLSKNPRILQAAFSHEVLDQGNNSEPIQLEGDTVVVLRVLKRTPAILRPLSEVKRDIETLLVKQQAQLAAKKIGETLISLQNQLVSQKAIVEKYHLKWVSVKNEIRRAEHVLPFINEAAFQLSRTGKVTGNLMKNGDFVLLKLTSITDGKVDSLSKEQQSAISLKIEEMYGKMDYDLYMSALLNNAKIVRY